MQDKTTPIDWTNCLLGDAIERIVGGGTPSRVIPSYWNGDIPWASVKDFRDDTKFLSDTEEHISSKGLANSTANLIEPNIPIVCTRMAVGRSALTTRAIAINQDLKAIYTYNFLDPRYLLFLLAFKRSRLESLSIGSTVKGINVIELLSLPISIPSKLEQQSIIKIIDTIDSTISQTEVLIAKLKQVKAGMLHDLLTCGLDENGKLRDRIAHPELFKDSGIEAIGLIPKGWDVTNFSSLYDSPIRDFGSFSMTNLIEFLPKGIPFLKSEMIEESALNICNLTCIAPRVHHLLKKSWVYPRDILYSKIGSALGKAVVYDGSLGICNSNAAIAKIKLNERIAIPEFFEELLNSAETKQRLLKNIISLLPRINLTDISNFQIILPSIEEQKSIVEMIQKFKSSLQYEQAYLDKLKQQKKGLMHDLLTGKVRSSDVGLLQ